VRGGGVGRGGAHTGVADEDGAGGAQPDVVPDAADPVAHGRHPVPAGDREVGGGVAVHDVGAGVGVGVPVGPAVAGAAGVGHRVDAHGEGVVAGTGLRGDVEAGALERVREFAEAGAVEPDFGVVVDAVELEPHAPVPAGRKAGRQPELAVVPPSVLLQRL